MAEINLGNIIRSRTKLIMGGPKTIFRSSNLGNVVQTGYVLQESMGQGGSDAHTVAWNFFPGTEYCSEQWKAAKSYRLKRIVVALQDISGGGAYTYTVEVRNHDGTNPTSVLATANIVPGILANVTDFIVDFSPGCDIQKGNDYCIVIHRGGAIAAEAIAWALSPIGIFTMQYDDDDAGAWTVYDATATPTLRTYSYE